MIRNIAELLTRLQQKEIELIEKSGMTHAPTIGSQYEGLTKAILERAIPPGLQLQVVTGFVEGVGGARSGQVDCMLVRGEGRPIPFTSGYVWPVQDVIAVFEVKKTLFSVELRDAHSQLKTVLEQFLGHAERLTDSVQFDVRPSLHMYGQIVGEPAPSLSQIDSLPFDKQMILRTLVIEQIAPLRIIIGYQGYANEHTLRTGFINFLRSRNGLVGYAGAAMPHLVVCSRYSLVKLNGHPYAHPLQNDQWLWYGSSVENPLVLMLNLLFTKLMYLASAPGWFESDLGMEAFAPLLLGKAAETGDGMGAWSYTPVLFTQRQLQRAEASIDIRDWMPLIATPFQATVAALIGCGMSRQALDEVAEEFPDTEVEREINELRKHGIVGWSDDRLVFLTMQCVTLSTAAGELVIGDADDPRLFEWLRRERLRHGANRQTSTIPQGGPPPQGFEDQ